MQDIFYGRKNNHHIVPKSRAKDWFDVENPRNQEYINQKVHEALHRLFANKTPAEQFAMLLEINQKVMQKKIVRQLQDLLSSNDFYINEVTRYKEWK